MALWDRFEGPIPAPHEARLRSAHESGPVCLVHTTTLTPTPPPLGCAWTRADLCAYLQCEPVELQLLINVDPTFPEPRPLAQLERWDPLLVIAWFTGRAVPGSLDSGAAPIALQRGGRSNG